MLRWSKLPVLLVPASQAIVRKAVSRGTPAPTMMMATGGGKLVLPVDHVVAAEFKAGPLTRVQWRWRKR